MMHDARNDDAEARDADHGIAGTASRKDSRGTGTAWSSTGGEAHGRSRLPIAARSEALLIGDVDITAARSALVEVGAAGSEALEAMSAQETIALLARLQDLSGALAAVQARALVQLEAAVKEDCLRREETPKQALKIARSEASKAQKQSKACAGQSLSSCRRLVRSMPGMLAALASGRVSATAVHAVGRTMGPAKPEQRSQVDAILGAHLPYLEGCGAGEWASEAEKILHGLDPRGAAERHQVAKRERHVSVRRGEHGMCTVTARLPALEGARIRKGLSVAAEKARAQGDRRGHQQIMADLFADALIGRGEGVDPSTLEIGVIITDRSLLAPGHADAALIEGYGAVPYEHIREEMYAAAQSAMEDPELAMALRQLYADSEDGQLVAVESRSRQFPPSLARFLRLAHQTCRSPYCDANIRQNDHIVPWAQGGPTSVSNGNGLCAADNQKEESGEIARVLTDENGVRRTVEWTSRYGQKASRRGINLDPLGTGLRLLDRAAQSASAPPLIDVAPTDAPLTDSPLTEPPPMDRPPAGQPPSDPPLTGSLRTTRNPLGPLEAAASEPESSLQRALERMERHSPHRTDPHPRFRDARRDRHRLLQGRTDYILGPQLTIIDTR